MSDTEGLVQVTLDLPESLADAAVGLAADAGLTGIEVRDEKTLVPEDAATPGPGRAHVVLWIDARADPESIASSIAARLSEHNEGADVTIHSQPVDPEDWVSKVRDQVEPVRLGRRLFVRATWHPPAKEEGLVELVLDPGLAFGTGQHATTALCLEAVEAVVDAHRRGGTSPTILDVGAGSGILSIAAVKLGARSALGIECDPTAVLVARENAAANGVAERCEFTTETCAQHGGVYDLVVANIQLGVLRDLAGEIAPRVRPGGDLFLSGLLLEQAEAAEATYGALGLECQGRTQRDGWACLHLRRPEAPRPR